MIKRFAYSDEKGTFQVRWLLLIPLIFLAACRPSSPIEGSPSSSPIPPIVTIPVSVTPAVLSGPEGPLEPYPGPYQFQTPEVLTAPYPPEPQDSNGAPSPTPPFDDGRVIFSETLRCDPGGVFSTCTDEYLKIRFELATEWGAVTATLRRGDAGLLYRYDFGQSYSPSYPTNSSNPEAGGTSPDFLEGRGVYFTDFQGFSDPARDPCDHFFQDAVCRKVHPDVYLYLYFPDWRQICEPGPVGLLAPLGIIAVGLPEHPQIKGLAFVYFFGSESLGEQYAEMETWLRGELAENFEERCVEGDELVAEYSRFVDELTVSVLNENADVDTNDNLWKFRHLANSIEILD